MCTTIAERMSFDGSAKGPDGWFRLSHLYVGYDHPTHVIAEHAVLVDLVDERAGLHSRVAFELSRERARDLARHLLAAADAADAYEAG